MAKQGASLESELQKLLDGLGEMPGIIGKLGDAVARFANALGPLQAAISRLLSSGSTATASPAEKSQTLLVSATDRNTVVTSRLSATMEQLIAVMTNTAMPNRPQGTPVPTPPPGAGGAAPLGAMGRLAAVAAIAAAAIAVFVVGINLAEREFAKLLSLVRLYSPGVVQMFENATANLSATIGHAFVPLIQVATQIAREWASAIAPVMQNLVPIVQRFSDAMGNMLVETLRQFASLLQSSLPVLVAFLEVFQATMGGLNAFLQPLMLAVRGLMLFGRILYEASGLGTVVRILTRVFEAFSKAFEVVEAAFSIVEVVVTSLMDAFMTLLSSLFPVKDIMDMLTRAVQWAIRGLYVFSVMLAKFLGFDGVADALIKSVEDKTKQGDTAAQAPQFKTLEQLGKDLALAAVIATGSTGQGGVKNQQEFWQRTLDEMRHAKNNGGSMITLLQEIRDLLKLKPGENKASAPAGPANPGVGGVPASVAGGGGGIPWSDIGGFVANPNAWLAKKALGFN